MRIWSFGGCEYDEEERRFWIRNKAAKLGDRVLDVLKALLTAPNHSCTSIDLSRLWGPNGSIDSAKDAIRQLRRAIQQGGIPEEVVRTVRGAGFQIAVTVTERTFEMNELWRSLRKGAPAPGLEGWELQIPLEPGPRARVWQIKNESNHLVRVVKYATDSARRGSLRREFRAWETFERGLKSQRCFVRIFSAHLTSRPCYVEAEYGGLNLIAWSDSQRSLAGLSREVCLQIMVDLAEAVAAAHSLGIIHNDLKPANILISPAPGQGSRWQVKVADFGVATVARENRLADFQLGDRTMQPASAGVGGTSLYRAPEVGPGTTPTFEADIYALGVIFFQLLCGDYQKTPYPGWEEQIDDPVLQQDIAAACNVDPARRPKAPILVERLATVELRRDQGRQLERERQEQIQRVAAAELLQRKAEQQLAAQLARRPLQRSLAVILALLVVVLGGGALAEIHTLRRARDKAQEERRSAETLQRFMEQLFFDGDVAARGPITSEGLAERGLEKARLLESEPRVHAELLNTLGGSFEVLGNYPKAEQLLQRALDERTRIFGAESPEVAETLIQQAVLKSDEGHPQAAMQLAQRALSLQVRALPADDIAITRIRTKIAEIWTELGEYERAVPLLEQAIRREAGHPDLLPDLSDAYNDLGIAEDYRGHLQRSLELQEASMRIDRELQGDRHPDVAEHLLSIANVHDLLGQYEQSATETREALSILQEWLPAGHHEIAAAQAHLGTELAHLPSSLPEARTNLDEALKTLNHEPERSRVEAYAYLALGSVDSQQGRDADALTAYENSLKIYRQIYPKPQLQWAVPLAGMASVYYKRHRWQDLQQAAGQAYQIANVTLPADDPRRLNASVLEARSLMQQQRPKEAEVLFREVLAHAPAGSLRTEQSREAAQTELAKLATR